MSETWLPRLILLEDFSGDWVSYFDAVYAAFCTGFLRPLPRFDGRRLGLKKMPEYDGKSCTFWHFISEGKVEGDRLPDLRRCERIGWPRPMLDEACSGTARVRVWSNRRGTEKRWVIALPDFSYVVVLADRGEFLLPWTAYEVASNRRRQLEREFENACPRKG